MTDPSHVITNDFLTSVAATLKQSDKALKLLETKGAKIDWFKDMHTKAGKQREALLQRIDNKRSEVGRTQRKDPSIVTLLKDVTAYAKSVTTAAKQEPFTSYYYGTTKVASDAALLTKIKAALPQACKGNASQALNDALKGAGKDAAKAGAGVKHASSGVKGVSSATVFFTRTDEQKGLETKLTVVGVGEHQTNDSYLIHDTFVSGLKKNAEFKL